jgi:hypothetical protein
VNSPFQPRSPDRFQAAVRHFDEENARDPHAETVSGIPRPRELVYAEWLTDWVLRLCPAASEELRLAARAQHLCRWMIPRDSHPQTRPGYLQWRAALKKFHAQKAGDILREAGYPEAVIERVQHLILKKHFPQDPESRILEDALCLVFLERQFADLASRKPDVTMINTLQKTWRKMTPAAQAVALKMSFAARETALLEQALRSDAGK